jgi:hypothetical protein
VQIYFFQKGDFRLDAIPDPHSDALAGRVFEPGNIIQQLMVYAFYHGIDYPFQLSKIHYPAYVRVQLALDIYQQAVGMAVYLPAFMSLGYIRQKMRGIENKLFEDLHGYVSAKAGAKVVRMI